MRVQAQHLQVGDICNGSKETVVRVTPGGVKNYGKMELILRKGERVRPAVWGKYTKIAITRDEGK